MLDKDTTLTVKMGNAKLKKEGDVDGPQTSKMQNLITLSPMIM